MSFLRAFPKLRKYVPKINEIKELPRSAFGKNLELMITGSSGNPKLRCKRYLWAKSKKAKFERFGSKNGKSLVYSMDDIRKRANVFTTKKGTLIIQNPARLFLQIHQQ